MKFTTTLKLFITVCLLGSLVYLANDHDKKKSVRRNDAHQLFDISSDDITGLAFCRSGVRIKCLKRDGTWFLKEPIRARADDASIERIIAMLEVAKWSDRISRQQRKLRGVSLDDYGLKAPTNSIRIDSDMRSLDLSFGYKVPLGKGRYAKFGNSSDVFVVGSELVDKLPKSVEKVRDRHLLHGNPEDTVKLEIARKGAGFIQLVRQGDRWMMQQPIASRADNAELRMMLDGLYNLEAVSFFWDAPLSTVSNTTDSIEVDASARIEACGLASDEARIKITAFVGGDSLGQELLLGKAVADQPGTIYAKRGKNSSIYTINDGILSLFDIGVNQLRDRRVFYATPEKINSVVIANGETRLTLEKDEEKGDAWNLVEPVQWSADRQSVLNLIRKTSLISVGKYLKQPVSEKTGLEHPAYMIAISCSNSVGKISDASDSVAVKRALLIGDKYDAKLRYAKFATEDEVFAIDESTINWLESSNSISSIHYFNRTMFAVDPAHVQQITVTDPSCETILKRDTEKGWVSPGNKAMQPIFDNIKALLIVLRHIEALSIKEHSPDTLTKYGLDMPRITVTVGLQGEDNIQKSLLLGKKTGDNRVYAMVRGQDVVFTVPSGLLEVFSCPLFKSTATSTNTVSTTGAKK